MPPSYNPFSLTHAHAVLPGCNAAAAAPPNLLSAAAAAAAALTCLHLMMAVVPVSVHSL
jgi:hypothetical protein